jgi:hypothetical protein
MANGNGNDYGPSFRLAKLYRKQSKNGATYFSGRLGFARATLLKSKETEGGEEIWNLVVSEAPQSKQDERPASGSPELQRKYAGNGTGNAQRPAAGGYTPRQQLDDDSIPF